MVFPEVRGSPTIHAIAAPRIAGEGHPLGNPDPAVHLKTADQVVEVEPARGGGMENRMESKPIAEDFKEVTQPDTLREGLEDRENFGLVG